MLSMPPIRRAWATMVITGRVLPYQLLVVATSTSLLAASIRQVVGVAMVVSPSAAVLMAGKIRRDSYFQKPSAGQRPEEEEACTRNESSRSPKEERASSFFRGDTLESERSEDG